jgi:16S rRNA C967 or C1407 C5-methylase (RsmB/RsmF family)/NOL1/NOP2/fmu family ribosome biogenesis protein
VQVPEKLLQSLEGIRGFNKETFVQVHDSSSQVTAIRLNPFKVNDDLRKNFAIEAGSAVAVPWSSHSYYLPSRPSFTFDPLFHAGCYYVQEASGMFVEQALRQTTDLSKPLRVLDLCAAPGGKSTLIQSLISKDSLLVSNEVIKSRAAILQENMVKWGAPNVIITNNDPRDFSNLENYFDIIVIDAPCSGSGLFRRDPEAVKEWSEENVQLCSLRQQRILADAWPALKQGGILVYSTCSYSKQEDEDILDWMAGEFLVDSFQLTVDRSWKIIETISSKNSFFGYRFYPDKLKGEGFFIAALQKKDGTNFSYPKTKKQTIEKLNNKEILCMKPWINQKEGLSFFKHHDLIHAFPAGMAENLAFIQSRLYLKKAGTLAGKIAAGELIPDHELALSIIINPGIPSVSLSKEEAIQYLRKEELKKETTLKGWALAQYENQNLGWMKILQNRINNYYPKEWRILKRE